MREKQYPTVRIITISTLMLLFGGAYAVFIALKPFKPNLTWLSVAIGDAVTDLGSFGVLYALTGNRRLAAIPFLSHLLTGGPMITGQILKHALQNGGGIVIFEDDERDDAA